MASNFNDTTPVAPANSVNVKWQTDGSGNNSGYIPRVVTLLPSVDTTGLTANVSITTLFAPTASGVYRVSAYIIVTTVDGASSTLPKVTITWTDPDNNTSQSFDITPTNAGNLLTTFQQGRMVIDAKTGINIQYATSGYTSGTPSIMTYALHLKIEQMF